MHWDVRQIMCPQADHELPEFQDENIGGRPSHLLLCGVMQYWLIEQPATLKVRS